MGRSHRNVDTVTSAELLELIVEFTWKLDHAEPAGFADLFTGDGTLITAHGRISGTAALQDFADKRTAMDRVSRSVLTNHRFVRLSESLIEGTVLVTLYLHDGRPPASAQPHSVSEYRDVYTRSDDKAWRFLERRSVPVFSNTP